MGGVISMGVDQLCNVTVIENDLQGSVGREKSI